MSCRTSSYFSSIESAIALPSLLGLPDPYSSAICRRRRDLLGQQRVLRLAARPGEPLLDLRHPRLERLPPQLAHAVRGASSALLRHAAHGDLRQQPPRALVLELRLHRRRASPVPSAARPPAPRAAARPARSAARSCSSSSPRAAATPSAPCATSASSQRSAGSSDSSRGAFGARRRSRRPRPAPGGLRHRRLAPPPARLRPPQLLARRAAGRARPAPPRAPARPARSTAFSSAHQRRQDVREEGGLARPA